ncbi:hypothetical protein ACFT7S_20295 [Streptomyces sp. NPDC057136]|uniref:hypothetical protein n=1 Tax=Streptomyces sp. NPDC057136 TaxID=3346029 RepID=UPI003645E1FD
MLLTRLVQVFTRSAARAVLVAVLGTTLVLTAPAPASYAGTRTAAPASERGTANGLYRYSYSLGLHPFTSPHDIRAQLTGNFWMFPVSGACPARIRAQDECDLLGGNPVRVESITDDYLQIVTLPGHDLGAGLHIRFTFTRSLGFHYLIVSAWQNKPTRCTEKRLCNIASRVGAWGLWRVLAETMTVSAYAA